MLKPHSFFGLIAMTLLFTFSSCDDDEVTRTDSDVALTFEYTVGDEAFNYEQIYTIDGVATKFYAVQFYTSGVEFMPSTGDAVAAPEVLLVKPNMTTDPIVTLDKGDYDQLNFFVGVSPADNDQTEEDFTSRDVNDPLAPQPSDQPRMHWNWNAGYIFFRIDGEVDTDGDGTPDSTLEYHVGTNNFRTAVNLDLNQNISDDATMVTLSLDVAQLFNNLDLTTESITHTGDFPDRAMTFVANIPGAMSVK